jgi:hypothetical protein
MLKPAEESVADMRGLGAADYWSSSSCHGIDWALRRSLLCKI